MCNFCCTFAADLRKWYLARAVRDRSAKPGTAVRIRQVPLKKPLERAAFFGVKGLYWAHRTNWAHGY